LVSRAGDGSGAGRRGAGQRPKKRGGASRSPIPTAASPPRGRRRHRDQPSRLRRRAADDFSTRAKHWTGRGEQSLRPITKVLKQRAAPRARLGLAHPGLLGEPFMLGPADRAIDASEEDRRGIEALAIGDETGGDVSSGLWTSHHDGTHWPLLLLCLLCRSIRYACENHLTQPRQERGTHSIHRTRRFAAAGNPQRNFTGYGTSRRQKHTDLSHADGQTRHRQNEG